MPLQQNSPVSVENNFTAGLKTEYTGLNFPENACTDVDNCVFSLIGDVTRRLGIDYEENYTLKTLQNRSGKAVTYFKWDNAGGDGETQILVIQVGATLYFYKITAATTSSPLSAQKLSTETALSSFINPNPELHECQYAVGNGCLIVFQDINDPFYLVYDPDTDDISIKHKITVAIRDFVGVLDNLDDSFRPINISNPHGYNLFNQGWLRSPNVTFQSTTNVVIGTGIKTFDIGLGHGAAAATNLNVQVTLLQGEADGFYPNFPLVMSGQIVSYVGSTLTLNIYECDPYVEGSTGDNWVINSVDGGALSEWNAALGNYPSNSDVWWRYKNTSNDFDPTTTLDQISQVTGPAPKGHLIYNAFDQTRSLIAGVSGLNKIDTTARPATGAWYAGRVWFAGGSASKQPQSDARYYSWTENVYFSQIVDSLDKMGHCYQVNDPTSEGLFALLPTDGGVITIPGCGQIYKLFPIQSGLLVFAARGIWFISGSQGLGFSATDYTINKVSDIQSISHSSFVNVQGMPVFWNEEGIYSVTPNAENRVIPTFQVTNLALGTILSFYRDIPLSAKKSARGDYDPIDYVIKWTYRSTEESGLTDRYEHNRVLNYNVANKAFYPYTITGYPKILGAVFVQGPGGSTSPSPTIKYITSSGGSDFTFSEERDEAYVDWRTAVSPAADTNYSSYFITGYKVHGQAYKTFQTPYVYTFSRNAVDTQYRIQGLWDYASESGSGRFSSIQLIQNDQDYFGVVWRRHRIRGRGLSFQLKVLSVDGQPFDLMGWTLFEDANDSV